MEPYGDDQHILPLFDDIKSRQRHIIIMITYG